MVNTNNLFDPGKLTTVMDGGAGSSGKGKLGSFIAANADNWTFACNSFAPQAGHWARLKDGRKYFYQTLNSCAYQNKYEKLYLGPGSIIELPALLREMEENNVPRSKLGISPVIPILEDIDAAFERGTMGFDGAPAMNHEGTSKFGSTGHGVGSVVARRVLRRPSLKLAKDIPALKDMICDVPYEIMHRLDRGESGLFELAQGFQLSLMHPYHFPYVTSRNVTVAQGFSDMFLPTKYAGQVVLNFRTFPIRINSNKYIGENGKHLTWGEVQSGIPHVVYYGDSGKWYPDQTELTWEDVTRDSGSISPIMEITSVTKLPRRVATFSKINVDEAIRHNDTGHGVHLSINFLNYIDCKVQGVTEVSKLTPKVKTWLLDNLSKHLDKVHILGTFWNTEDSILLDGTGWINAIPNS